MKKTYFILLFAFVVACSAVLVGCHVGNPLEYIPAQQWHSQEQEQISEYNTTRTQDERVPSEMHHAGGRQDGAEQDKVGEDRLGQDMSDQSAAQPGWSVSGTWNNRIYVNEHLGFSFVMNEEWAATTDEDIGEIMDAAEDIFADDIGEVIELTTVHDMMAQNSRTGASVQIIYERLASDEHAISESEYIEIAASYMEQIGMRIVNTAAEPTRIGNYYWYCLESELEVSGLLIRTFQFVNIQNNSARIIVITYNDGYDTIENILAMFN